MEKTVEELARELVISKGELKKLLNQIGVVEANKTGLNDKQVRFLRLIVGNQRQRHQEKITSESYEEQVLEEAVEERGFPAAEAFGSAAAIKS